MWVQGSWKKLIKSAMREEGARVMAKAMPSVGPAINTVNETTIMAASERVRTKRFDREFLGDSCILGL
jgi:hypothetical protein